MSDIMHACPAPDCEVRLAWNIFACKKHWRALPVELRRAVHKQWREGTVEQYNAAREEAVIWLADNT